MRTNSRDFESAVRKLYDVADVKIGFDYWWNKLLNILLSIFEYDGLPESLPQREIEIQLLCTGHCLILTITISQPKRYTLNQSLDLIS